MKKIFYLLFASGFLFASLPAQSDKAAVKIVEDMAFILQKNAVQTNFSMTVKQGSSTQKMSGAFVMQGNKFALNTSEMKVYFDGSTQWAYSPDINEVSISNPTEKELAETNPLAILSSYKAKSTIRFAKKQDDKSAHLISLTPSAKNAEFKLMQVKIAKLTNYPLLLQLTDKKGNVSTLSLSQFRKGVKTSKDTFTFKPSLYKDIEINDLR